MLFCQMRQARAHPLAMRIAASSHAGVQLTNQGRRLYVQGMRCQLRGFQVCLPLPAMHRFCRFTFLPLRVSRLIATLLLARPRTLLLMFLV